MKGFCKYIYIYRNINTVFGIVLLIYYILCTITMYYVRTSPRSKARAFALSRSRFFFLIARTMALYLFFTALSVRPGKHFVIFAHWLPNSSCIVMIISSSAELQLPFFMSGLRWLYQRSLQCFPVRSGNDCATIDQLLMPCCEISFFNTLSSSSDQGCFCKSSRSSPRTFAAFDIRSIDPINNSYNSKAVLLLLLLLYNLTDRI